jgi:hypothetical protein
MEAERMDKMSAGYPAYPTRFACASSRVKGETD